MRTGGHGSVCRGLLAATVITAVLTGSLAVDVNGGRAAGAATDDCGFTGLVNSFDANGGETGAWTDPNMWDGNVVPTSGQACILPDKTAELPNGVTSFPDVLGIEGTLKVTGTGVVVNQANKTVENKGRVEVPAGMGFSLGFSGPFKNLAGGVVRVEGTGFFNVSKPFENLGGEVDVTGGGLLNILSANGRFVQGQSTDPIPVQGTVAGGAVNMHVSTTLQATGTGEGAFAWPPGSNAILEGALAEDQTIDVVCNAFDSTMIRLLSNASSAGTIRYNPRLSGTSCNTELIPNPGVTFTNNGDLIFGDPAQPTAPFNVRGQGAVVNGPDGTVTVHSLVGNSLLPSPFSNDGDFIIGPGGNFTTANNASFELRDGTLQNNGTFVQVAAGTFGQNSVYRHILGTHSGNPVRIQAGRFELLGPGPVAIEVPQDGTGVLQNPNGPILIRDNQSITIAGNVPTVGPVENQGLITLAGRGDRSPSFGTSGTDAITNHGTIRYASLPNTGVGGNGRVVQPVTNETDGVIEVLPGRSCELGPVTNHGLIDLRSACTASFSPSTFSATSIVRVHSSASDLTAIRGLIGGSTLGGTLDVITDSGNPPPLGPPRDIAVGRQPGCAFCFHPVAGSFDTLLGSVSPTLGYALSYPIIGGGRRAQLQVVQSVSDLVVSSLDAPDQGAVGQDVTVTWNTTLGASTSTPFTDSVFLSSGPVPDSSSFLLGRLQRTGPTTGGVARAGSLSVRLPAGGVGSRHIVVVADSGLALAGDRAAALSSVPIDVVATPLALGSGPAAIFVGLEGQRVVGAGTAFLEGSRLLRLTGPAGDAIVDISPPNAVVAWGATGRVPSEADHDVALEDGRLIVPQGDGASERYVLLRNTGGAPVTVDVTAAAPGLSITSSSPDTVLSGAPAPTAIEVHGTGFTPDSEAKLVCGATTVNATLTQVDGTTGLTSLFPLPNPLGACDVVVDDTATLNDALTVNAPAVPVNAAALEATIDIDAPGIIRSGVDNRIKVRWKNETGYSLPAPLFQVSVDNGTIRFPGSPANGAQRVDVLGIASDGPAGILAPGDGGSTELLVRGVGAHEEVTYFVAGIKSAHAVDFGKALSAGLGPAVPAAGKAWVEANGPALLGVPAKMKASVFAAHLADVATHLSGLGRRVPEVARLVLFDLSCVTESGRLEGFLSGEYGIGQGGLAIPRLVVEAGSNDAILSAGDLQLRFARQANGSYVSPPAIGDLLTANAGGWSLVSRNGTRRSFSTAGRLTAITDPDQRVTTFAYSGDRLTSITDPAGDSTTYTYDGNGRITAESGPFGRARTYTYDGNGHVESTTANGLTTSVTWGADGLPDVLTRPDGVVVDLTRDAFGRVTAVRTNGAVHMTYVYNADGSTTTTDADGNSVRVWLDDTGGLAKGIDSGGRVTTARRDAKGNPVGMVADGVPVGDMVLTDAAGVIKGTVDGAGKTTQMTFDVDGVIHSVVDPDGHRTTIQRDAALRPTSVTDPSGASSSYTYDSVGRPATVTDRSGRSVTNTYDAEDRLIEQEVPGYGTVTYAYDARRNLDSVTGPTGTTDFTFNSKDELTGIDYPNGLGLTFAYDSAGRRFSTTTSDGQTTTATYNDRGRIATLSSDGEVISRYEYDAVDRWSATGNANGTRTEVTHDPLGRVVRQHTTCCTPDGASVGPTEVTDVTLTYDARDRVATRTDAGGTTVYSYDGADRLVGAVTTGAVPRTLAYTYDDAGNRLTTTDSVAGNVAATIGAAGRPTQIGGEAVAHDAEGRQTSRGPRGYTWDANGSLSEVTSGGATTTYTYDGLGTPIARETNGATTKLLMDVTGALVGEYTDTGVREAGYAWGQGVAARLDGTGTASSWYATDPRGDVVALTDGAGAVSDSYRYLPFGEVAERTGTTTQPFAFQGQWGLRTEPTGLIDVRARTYDPAIGRFLSEDPVLFAAANPSTWASSDPINRTDTGGTSDSPFVDALTYPDDLLGFSSGPGSTNSNLANLGGFATLAGGSWADSTQQSVVKLAQAAEAKSDKAWAAYNAMKPPPPKPPPGVKIDPGVQRWRDAREATRRGLAKQALSHSKDSLDAVKSAKTLGNISKGIGLLGVGFNAIQGWEAYKKNPNAFNGIRQGAKLFLKTVSPPIVGLAFDTIEKGVDEASLLGFQRLHGVDPILLYNETGWNARYELKKKKGKSGAGDSSDPNAIIGPVGVTVGAERFVSVGDDLPYMVQFENMETATLPATEVVVTQTLDPDLDLTTFELGTVGVGERQWEAPPGLRAWSTLLDDRDQSGLFIRLKAKLDLGTREVKWTLTGIDPDTGDVPVDATRGFLPPNDTSPEGQGFLTYDVRALEATPTGASVPAQASIVFDANPAIATNLDTVTVDAVAPTATPSVPAAKPNLVSVTLGVADDAGGSGAGASDVFASKNGAPYKLVAEGVTGSLYKFQGAVGARYRFRVVPRDRAGNEGDLSAASGEVLVQRPPLPIVRRIPPGRRWIR